MSRTVRIALVGAGRTRQGLGPYVARDLQAAGAEVVAFCTSGPKTMDRAGAALETQGVHARGHASLQALLEAEQELDALAILTPPRHHGEGLEAALDRGLHALCEKPLGLEPFEQIHDLVVRFGERGLALLENCQWPATLGTAAVVLGRALAEPPSRFAMGLTPEGQGRKLLEDSLSHPLSLLQRLHGAEDGRAAGLECEGVEIDRWRSGFRLVFSVRGPRGTTRCEVELDPAAISPKPAWYSLDGERLDRRIDPATYAMQLAGPERACALPDPLTAHLAAVTRVLAATLSGSPAPPVDELLERATLLDRLLAAFDARNP